MKNMQTSSLEEPEDRVQNNYYNAKVKGEIPESRNPERESLKLQL